MMNIDDDLGLGGYPITSNRQQDKRELCFAHRCLVTGEELSGSDRGSFFIYHRFYTFSTPPT